MTAVAATPQERRFPFLARLYYGGTDAVLSTGLINLMFEIALVALLLHPRSRDYQRIWFK